MARQRELMKYPKEYWILFQQASKRTMTLTHETQVQAEATRNDLYSFRKALYAVERYHDEALEAQNVRLSISGKTLTAEPIIRRTEDEHNES